MSEEYKIIPLTKEGRRITYSRIHTADEAWIMKRPRGIFTAIGKLVDAGTLTEEETKEYWKNREYFEKILAVPPIYEDGNSHGATTWFKNNQYAESIISQMGFYFAMAEKYGLKLYKTICAEIPGEILYEDQFQIAVKENDNYQKMTEEFHFSGNMK